MSEPVRFLLGPTGAGKSELALAAATRLNAEILSLDSMAVYRRMDIGTAKPDPAERRRVPHHLLDLVEPWDSFDAARYREAAIRAVAEVGRRGRRVLFVGGTPFYFKILTEGLFPGPAADPELRRRLRREEEEGGEGTLHRRLAKIDPELAGRLHRRDLKRVIRALEVHRLTGTPLSRLQTQWGRQAPILAYRAAGLDPKPERLRERIRRRTARMVAAGLEEETAAILAAGGFSKQAGSALGYAQVLAMLAGELPREELEERILTRTWNFVRKQRTWFRKFDRVRWFDPAAGGDPVDTVLALLAREGE